MTTDVAEAFACSVTSSRPVACLEWPYSNAPCAGAPRPVASCFPGVSVRDLPLSWTDLYLVFMSSLPLVSSPVKALLVVVGLGMGALDVKKQVDELDKAMKTPSARVIGEQMFIRDPYFVVKTWGGHVGSCATNTWCYLPPPGESRPSANDISAWAKVGPVYVLRMAVFPIFQTGRTLVHHGWTARAIFLFSFVVAFLLFRSRTEKTESPPGGVVVGLLGFLVVSIVLSFALNLLLRLGNAVAGYWGVLVAMATGIYFTLELAGKVREFVQLFRGGTRE
jgi:hypothetical protein